MDAKINKLQPLDEITIDDDDLLTLVVCYVNMLTENGMQEVMIASAHQDDYNYLIRYLRDQVYSILPTCAHPIAFDLFTADILSDLGINIEYYTVLRKKWENLPNNDLAAVRVKVHNDLRVYFPRVINVTAQGSIYTLTGGYTIDAVQISAVKSLDDINNESRVSFTYSNKCTRDTITVSVRSQLDLRDVKPTDYTATISDTIMEILKSNATRMRVGLTAAFSLET